MIIETTKLIAVFIAPNGVKCESEILTDYENGYDYVVDNNNESWLLNQVKILVVFRERTIEFVEFVGLE
jgi:hypothetical protein